MFLYSMVGALVDPETLSRQNNQDLILKAVEWGVLDVFEFNRDAWFVGPRLAGIEQTERFLDEGVIMIRKGARPREGQSMLDFIARERTIPRDYARKNRITTVQIRTKDDHFEPLSAEMIARYREEAKEFRLTDELRQEWRGMKEGTLDPSLTDSWMMNKVWMPAARMLPFSLQAAVPYIGLPATVSSIYGMRLREYVERDIPIEEAMNMAAISALVEAPIERLQINRALGRFTGLDRFMKLPADSIRNIMLRATTRLGANLLEQNLQEFVQDLTPLIIQEIGSRLSSQIPQLESVEWSKFENERLDTFFALLPMVMLGAGMGNVQDMGNYASAKGWMAAGFTRADSEAITSAATPQEAQMIAQEALARLDPHSEESKNARAEVGEQLEHIGKDHDGQTKPSQSGQPSPTAEAKAHNEMESDGARDKITTMETYEGADLQIPQKRSDAKDWALANLRNPDGHPTYHKNNYTGKDIEVGSTVINHTDNQIGDTSKFRMIEKLPEIIGNVVPREMNIPYRGKQEGVAYSNFMYTPLILDGKPYVGKLTIHTMKDGHLRAYDLKIHEIDGPDGASLLKKQADAKAKGEKATLTVGELSDIIKTRHPDAIKQANEQWLGRIKDSKKQSLIDNQKPENQFENRQFEFNESEIILKDDLTFSDALEVFKMLDRQTLLKSEKKGKRRTEYTFAKTEGDLWICVTSVRDLKYNNTQIVEVRKANKDEGDTLNGK